MIKIGILHPGEMGISIAASAINTGQVVCWVSENRSEKTRLRAEKYGLSDMNSLTNLCRSCEIIISICPPHAAKEVANSVIKHGFNGYYLDANAIAPNHTNSIGRKMDDNGIHFVDGCIIGGPAWKPNETWLYLSGKDANVIADCFANGPLETKIIGHEIGKASALKMCYAAYSKGTTALLAASLAAAESLGVRDELCQKWDMDDPNFSEDANRRVKRVTAKAWRFEGEMHEIAATFQEAGLPNGFHEASAEIFHHMANFKDAAESPRLEDILNTLFKK